MSLAVVGQPSGPKAWAALLTELAAELREVQHERGQLLAAGISEQPDQPRRKVINDKHHASSLPATMRSAAISSAPVTAILHSNQRQPADHDKLSGKDDYVKLRNAVTCGCPRLMLNVQLAAD